MTNASVSSEHLTALSALADLIPAGTAVALDPSDPVHRAGIEAALAAAGRTADRYPALHAALNGNGAGTPDTLTLLDLGKDRSGNATAMTLHAGATGNIYTGGALFAFDGTSGALLASGDNSNVGDGAVAISTKTAAAQSADGSLQALSVNHSVTQNGTTSFTAYATEATPVTSGDMTFTIEQPTLTPKNGQYLQIALGRLPGVNSTDVDYYYYSSSNDANPYLICPFLGSAILPYDVSGTPGQPLNGAATSAFIYISSGGTVYQYPVNTTYTTNFANRVTMDASNSQQVDWSYAYQAGSYYNSTTSIVYAQSSLVNINTCYFVFNFSVPVTGAPISPYAFTVCSVNTPEESSPQCHKIIPQIMFVAHCLAQGTLVTLADGGKVPIEALNNGHRVSTGGEPSDLAVEATTHGEHEADENSAHGQAMYRLTTDAGHELVATGLHPIQTPDGLAQLDALAPGDVITTDSGTAKVASCQQIAWKGLVHNLKLGDEADRAGGLDKNAVCTFIANGIVVGDVLSQRAEHYRITHDIDLMRRKLPDSLVTDYASAIEDIRY
ncbi:Hint domain-containing protein [Sphingomonas sp.]|jgi:hypothetical protein|uniref:Hint domain-containing protein n=1 Tax=Sphingomonas sp. TaxID=28214 RepID=UPI00356B2DE2